MPSSVILLGDGRANHRCHFQSVVQGEVSSCFHHQTLGMPSLAVEMSPVTLLPRQAGGVPRSISGPASAARIDCVVPIISK